MSVVKIECCGNTRDEQYKCPADVEASAVGRDAVPQLDVVAGGGAAEQGALLRALRQAQPAADAQHLGRPAGNTYLRLSYFL